MKTLTNVNVASFSEAAAAAQSARQQGKLPAFFRRRNRPFAAN
ncbi:MAG: hypothetical protein ACJZ8M_01210 [Pseudohongiellaceae bacterium]